MNQALLESMREVAGETHDLYCGCSAPWSNEGFGCDVYNGCMAVLRCEAAAHSLRQHLDNAAGDSSWVMEALEILEGKS